MELNDYQRAALRTAAARTKPNELFHLVLGLNAEAGEVAELFQKLVRDAGSDLESLDRRQLALELGDVLWHLAVLADYFDIPLEAVGEANIGKVTDRARRGMLGGSGGER